MWGCLAGGWRFQSIRYREGYMLHEGQTNVVKSYSLIAKQFEGCRNNSSSRVYVSVHNVLPKDCLILWCLKTIKTMGGRCNCYLQEMVLKQ